MNDRRPRNSQFRRSRNIHAGFEYLEDRHLLSAVSLTSTVDTQQTIEFDNATTASASLAELRFHTWAPEGSIASLAAPDDALVGMAYGIGSSSGAMALLRGSFPAENYPDGKDLSSGIELYVSGDAVKLVIVLHDISGETHHRWVEVTPDDTDKINSFTSSDLGELRNIRNIDFVVVEPGANGEITIRTHPTQVNSDNDAGVESDTANDTPAAESSNISELIFRVWASDDSNAVLVDNTGDDVIAMDFEVNNSQGAMALLRGTYPDTLHPNGVDVSSGIQFRISSTLSRIVIVIQDIHGGSRHRQIENLVSDNFTAVQFSEADLAGLGNLRSIDFSVLNAGATGSIQLQLAQFDQDSSGEQGEAGEDEEQADDTPATSIWEDLTFRVWAPQGSSARLRDDVFSGMDFEIGTDSGSMALLRGTFSDSLHPGGVDLSDGFAFDITSDSSTIIVVWHDVDGSTRHHWVPSPNETTTISFVADDLVGLNGIRRIDFGVLEQGTIGSLQISSHTTQDGSETTDPPINPTATVRDLDFQLFAGANSSATLLDNAPDIFGAEYEIGHNPDAMVLLRGTFSSDRFPEGADLSDGIDLGFLIDASELLVTFSDVAGNSRQHWIPATESFYSFSASDLAGLVNIRNIDFGIVQPGAAGTLRLSSQDPCSLSLVECIRAGDEVAMQQMLSAAGESKYFYVYADAELTALNIVDRQGDELHFLEGSAIVGHVQTPGPWTTDRGVVNITNSSDLLITGLTATNQFQYQGISASVDVQSSTALNVSWSHDIHITNATLLGNGKSAVWIQGNSTVELVNADIECYYFCVGIAASDVHARRLSINQFNPVIPGDKHATFWISSTMRATLENVFYGNSNVIFEDTTIQKRTGEGMVAGNGGYDYRSHVVFRGTTQIESADYAYGVVDAWLPIHRNYFGITLYLEDTYPTTVEVATEPNEFGKFLIHHFGADILPPVEAPLVVCIGDDCVSTNDILE